MQQQVQFINNILVNSLKKNSLIKNNIKKRTISSMAFKSSSSLINNEKRKKIILINEKRINLMMLINIILLIIIIILANNNNNFISTIKADSSFNGQVFKHSEKENDSEFWLKAGRDAINQALKYEINTNKAKNAILFIGDGMSLSTITAARILYGQMLNQSGEEQQLSFERLNNIALIKTYNVDQQIPDSAATATAILSGIKTNFYTLGVNANVKLNETDCKKIHDNKVATIIKQAIDAGKSTGIVTNTRITHATPAAAYAHVSNRRWECDNNMPNNIDSSCKDITRQLIEDDPGQKINVIMGGGRRCFFGSNTLDFGPNKTQGLRKDGKNLINQWIDKRKANNHNYAFVNMTGDLKSLDTDNIDYLLGLFSYSHMNFEELRPESRDGEPSLKEMTEIAIKILSKNPKGYVLIVESGRIDHAHHENVASVALRETIMLSWAVQSALSMINQRDTLVGVTSDHAHALTINGLAPRGNPILGLSRFPENSTKIPYTTLIYGNGPGHHQPRRDPLNGPNSPDTPYYIQYAAIHQEEAFHDGSDVAIFASGPFAHLFQGVQEQSYIAHVFSYALCMGQYSNRSHCSLDGDSKRTTSLVEEARRRSSSNEPPSIPSLFSLRSSANGYTKMPIIYDRFTIVSITLILSLFIYAQLINRDTILR